MPDWQEYASEGRRLGPADAPVTIIEFGDYECPACVTFHRALRAVQRQFGDTITIVYRHFPLETHAMGQFAARAAECAAQQGRFAEYHHLLYENLTWRGLGLPAFQAFGRLVSVPDSVAFGACLQSVDEMPTLTIDYLAGVQLGLQVTPTVLVNDRWLKQLPDSAYLVEAIREALGHD